MDDSTYDVDFSGDEESVAEASHTGTKSKKDDGDDISHIEAYDDFSVVDSEDGRSGIASSIASKPKPARTTTTTTSAHNNKDDQSQGYGSDFTKEDDPYHSDFEQSGIMPDSPKFTSGPPKSKPLQDSNESLAPAATTTSTTSSRTPEEQVRTAKMELEAQRNRTAETHKEIQAKERGLDEDSLNLERKIRELEVVLNNPKDPSLALMMRIRMRKELASKKQFLNQNLKHVNAKIEKARATIENTEKRIQEKQQEIELKKQRDQEGLNDQDLESQVFETSMRVVEEGNKNLVLSRKVVKAKEELARLEEDMAYARSLLIKAIGRREKTSEDMGLTELLNMYSNLVAEEMEASGGQEAEGNKGEEEAAGAGTEEERKKLRDVEKCIHDIQVENETLEAKIGAMELDLQVAQASWEDVHALKSKVGSFKRRFQAEKDDRLKAEKGKKTSTRKIVLLSKHIEKLMEHIKHEAVAKARAQGRKRKAARELKLLRTRSTELLKKMHQREELIGALKQGARLLEDQLKLMDNRYLELRGKLDYTKASSEMQIRKAQVDLEDIQAKYYYVRSLFPEGIIDPQDLRNQLNALVRTGPIATPNETTMSLAASTSPTGMGGNMTLTQPGLGGKATATTTRKKRKKKKVNLDYPSITELIKEEDPDKEIDLDRQHLWSQAKIDLLKSALKNYKKAPVKPIA